MDGAGGGGGAGSNFANASKVSNVSYTTDASGTPSATITYSVAALPPVPATGARGSGPDSTGSGELLLLRGLALMLAALASVALQRRGLTS